MLATGGKCFGFFTPDHAVGKGRNILLVPEFDERECLRAYRQGSFYGAIEGNGLRFSNVTLAGQTLFVAIHRKGVIRLASNKGEALKSKAVTEVEYRIPTGKDGRPGISYIRAEAFDETSEKLFCQPIMFQLTAEQSPGFTAVGLLADVPGWKTVITKQPNPATVVPFSTAPSLSGCYP